MNVQWAGKEGLTMIEWAEVTDGAIETNKISNQLGYSFCNFTIDSYIEIQHGNAWNI